MNKLPGQGWLKVRRLRQLRRAGETRRRVDQKPGTRRDRDESQELVMHVSMVTIALNVALSIGKLAAGVWAHSGAMVSDGVHSASDVLSTIIVMIGTYVSKKKSDEEHPYGHERMECVASMVLASILFATGVGIGVNGIQRIVMRGTVPIAMPGKMALAAAIVSIAVKEWMYRYTAAAAKRAGSGALMADAWHHRSDAASSVGALVGIAGARFGLLYLDPAVGVMICILIGKAAIAIFKEAMDQMVDKACSEDVVERMKKTVQGIEGVSHLDEIRTRRFGCRVYVDIEIAAPGSLPLVESHRIAEKVHLSIEEQFPEVKHCMVHVNPMEEGRSEAL